MKKQNINLLNLIHGIAVFHEFATKINHTVFILQGPDNQSISIVCDNWIPSMNIMIHGKAFRKLGVLSGPAFRMMRENGKTPDEAGVIWYDNDVELDYQSTEWTVDTDHILDSLSEQNILDLLVYFGNKGKL